MSLTAEAMRRLQAMGLTLEQIIEVADANSSDITTKKRERSSGAERQRRYRERQKEAETVTRDVTGRNGERDEKAVTTVTKSVTCDVAHDARVRDITYNSEITGYHKSSLRSDGSEGDLFSDVTPERDTKRRRKKPEIPMPPDWAALDHHRDYAAQQGLTPEETDRAELEFREYFLDRQTRRAGWDLSWQRWVRTAVDRKRERDARLARSQGAGGGGRGVIGLGEIIARRRAEEPY